MEKDWNIIEILSYSRHDWLNKLQLIKGNLALNKLDRVREIIEEIVIEAQHDSKLTNLNLPLLGVFLMTYNWGQHRFQIEYEVLGEIKDLSQNDELITSWCKELFTLIDEVVESRTDNHLSITIELDTSATRFFFDFRGILTDSDKIATWLSFYENVETIKLIQYQVHKKEMTVAISI